MRDQTRSYRTSAKTGGETGRGEVEGTVTRYFSLFLKAAILRLVPFRSYLAKRNATQKSCIGTSLAAKPIRDQRESHSTQMRQ